MEGAVLLRVALGSAAAATTAGRVVDGAGVGDSPIERLAVSARLLDDDGVAVAAVGRAEDGKVLVARQGIREGWV